MPKRAFEYAIIRVVPHVEREEFMNAGVILFCAEFDFLGARIEFDQERLLSFAQAANLQLIREHLEAIPKICAGGPDAGSMGQLPPRERFQWLVAPRSTILQTSATHTGLCDAPERVLDHLIQTIVRISPRRA